MAFVPAICSRDTLVLIKDPKVRANYQKTHIGLAIAMVVSPIAAYAFNVVPRSTARSIGQSCSAFRRLPDIGVSRPRTWLDLTSKD
jgi:hypothetical protein